MEQERKMEQERLDRQRMEKRGYAVGRLLGQGAFSRVYSVEERDTGRRAACKVSENLKLLRREEEILKKLRHPLFPEFYESWRDRETGFLLMEEVMGENLAELIRRGGKWTVYQVAELGMELAEGLLYLHGSRPSIIFRDVKPENIMLRSDGRVKLLDFGCACEPDMESGTRAGSPGFAAPEQLAGGGEQTHLCDVYGLGRTLQELLWAGTQQCGRKNFLGRLREGRDRRRLEKLLSACVEREPSARPADMRVVAAALFHLCAPTLGGRLQGCRGSDFWQRGITCEKNIQRSAWKIS